MAAAASSLPAVADSSPTSRVESASSSSKTSSSAPRIGDQDLGSSDELKIFSEEGDEEEEEVEEGAEVSKKKKNFLSSEIEQLRVALSEEKSLLIQETEMAIKQENMRVADAARPSSSPGSPYASPGGYSLAATAPPPPPPPQPPPPQPPPPPLVLHQQPQQPPPAAASPSSYQSQYGHNHAVRCSGSPLSPPFYDSSDLGSPPPAHIGGLPYTLADPGLRSLYPMSGGPPTAPPPAPPPPPPPPPPPHGAYPYSLITSEMSQFSPPCPISRYGSLLTSSPGDSSVLPTSSGSPSGARRSLNGLKKQNNSSNNNSNHIKKPLNAFMLYMKEMRPKIVAECTLKESAAINQILGRRWHGLSREEQAKYYELARKERQLHMQLYPGWSARDNYAQNKKKKRKRMQQEKETSSSSSSPTKKCRIRYTIEQQDQWNRIGKFESSSPLLTTPPPPPQPPVHFGPASEGGLINGLPTSSNNSPHPLMEMHLSSSSSNNNFLTMDTILLGSQSSGNGSHCSMAPPPLPPPNSLHHFMETVQQQQQQQQQQRAAAAAAAAAAAEGELMAEAKMLAAAAAAAAATANGATQSSQQQVEEQSPKYISL